MSVKRYEWVVCDEHAFHCDVVESAEGDMVDYEYYAALEAKCAALAAENAGLKSVVAENCNLRDVLRKLIAGRPGGCYFIKWEPLIFKALNETSTTDAFLAEVRAQGVEMFAEKLREHIAVDSSGSTRARALTRIVDRVSEQIRKGVQS